MPVLVNVLFYGGVVAVAAAIIGGAATRPRPLDDRPTATLLWLTGFTLVAVAFVLDAVARLLA